MAIELHTTTKPASRLRALVSSFVLLAFAATLAGTMTWSRTREPLGPRIEPPGWGISFRPPKGFLPGDLVQKRLGAVLPFHGLTTSGNDAMLAFQVFAPVNDEPDAICDYLVRQYSFAQAPLHVTLTPTEAALGPLEGVEIHAPQLWTVVRVALSEDGFGYAVALAVDGEPPDDSLYGVFDLTCGSIENTEP